MGKRRGEEEVEFFLVPKSQSKGCDVDRGEVHRVVFGQETRVVFHPFPAWEPLLIYLRFLPTAAFRPFGELRFRSIFGPEVLHAKSMSAVHMQGFYVKSDKYAVVVRLEPKSIPSALLRGEKPRLWVNSSAPPACPPIPSLPVPSSSSVSVPSVSVPSVSTGEPQEPEKKQEPEKEEEEREKEEVPLTPPSPKSEMVDQLRDMERRIGGVMQELQGMRQWILDLLAKEGKHG